jgi:hypothetical protein
MTRRGTLAYYLSAWVCGCFFVSLAVWLHATTAHTTPFMEPTGVAGLLIFYFYSLIFGLVSALLGSFLLRRIAVAVGWKHAWQWVLAGGVLTPGMLFAMGRIAHTFVGHPLITGFESLALMGPVLVTQEGVWLAAPGGAVTAFILRQVHTAFAQAADAREAPSRQNVPSA